MDYEDDSQSLNNGKAQENETVFHPAPDQGTDSWTQQKCSCQMCDDRLRGDAEGPLF